MKGYIKEFDTLRAFSVLAVMLQHYFGQFRYFSVLGSCGVTMFFVLSGFLITQILLEEKKHFNIDTTHNIRKIGYVLKVFYIRRALRIFPIYYITLFLLALLNIDSAREYFVYHFFYLSNFIYSFRIGLDNLAHFWSLAVEEQFYFIWPLLILLLPYKWNKIGFFVILIALSILFKAWMIYLYPDSFAWYFLMPGCIESFSLGAIAVLLTSTRINKSLLVVMLFVSAAIFLVLQIVFFKNYSFPVNSICNVFSRTFFSLFSALVLILVAKGMHHGIIRSILTNKYLMMMGKISYGIYIYHHFVPGMIVYVQEKLHFSLAGTGLSMVLNFAGTFLIAYISFKVIETPINNLKRKFAYK